MAQDLLMWANEAFHKVLTMPFQTVLDIGSGAGEHAQGFRAAGKTVTTISLREPADILCPYLAKNFIERFDLIWASHVLEHEPNPNDFLRKCYGDLNDDGILAVTVPPLKHQIVGGHINLYNAGILLYQLILAGFDCSQAQVKSYGYNISVVVRKKKADLPKLNMDCGDIELLAPFFPMPVSQGFDGQIAAVNWNE